MKQTTKMNLESRMNLFTLTSILPLAALAIYAIISMQSFYKQYDQIVRNITAANEYNLSFKNTIDETMYQIIIGSENWSDSEEKLKGEDPYAQIEDARKGFQKLYNISSTEGNKRRLKGILRLLNTLEERVDEIIVNVQEGGHYDENMEMLNMNINILSEILQEKIQEYIYYEASSMEVVRQKISRSTSMTIQVLSICFLFVLLISWYSSRVLAESIAKPIHSINRFTEKVASGNFTVRAEESSIVELDALSKSFNSMVSEISSLVNDIKIEQKNLQATELKLLQAQINPHFLYNTLDTIIWLAEDNQKEQVVSMVTSLSDFFRTTLSKGRDFITIAEEESHIRSYLEIQQFRYRDILDYEISIPDSISQCRILKLTLQPIIENALYHGIKNKRGKGMITVTGERSGDVIELCVKDNGIGMKIETLEHLRRLISGKENDNSQHGFGMANVEQRIWLNFGREYGLSIESEYEVGTTVTVKIPVVVQPEKNTPFS